MKLIAQLISHAALQSLGVCSQCCRVWVLCSTAEAECVQRFRGWVCAVLLGVYVLWYSMQLQGVGRGFLTTPT